MCIYYINIMFLYQYTQNNNTDTNDDEYNGHPFHTLKYAVNFIRMMS